MINNKVKFSLILLSLSLINCSSDVRDPNKKTLILMVENRLISPLSENLKQYKTDLEKDGYSVFIDSSKSSDSTPLEIRSNLQKFYENDQSLNGVVFIGNIRSPLYNDISDEGDPYWHDYLSDFYYMDLDGVWEDTNGNGVLDRHENTEITLWNKIRKKLKLGNKRTPEIWVSRIRADKLDSFGDEINLLKIYFAKIHNYRTGKMKIPKKRAFVVSSGVDVLNSEWGAWPNKLYNDIVVDKFHEHQGDSLKKFLNSAEGYEWGIINAFSGPRIHHLGFFNHNLDDNLWKTRDGRRQLAEFSDMIVDSQDVTWKDIVTIQPNILFYHLLCSEVGRYDYPDYLAGAYIFSGAGLIAIAGTQHSGTVGVPMMYEELAVGKSFGEAWKDALTWLEEHQDELRTIRYFPNDAQKSPYGESIHKAVLIGDGTLKLPN